MIIFYFDTHIGIPPQYFYNKKFSKNCMCCFVNVVLSIHTGVMQLLSNLSLISSGGR